MAAKIIPVKPFDYVVFGASGDLTYKKLVPALYYRFFDGQFDENSKIIGVARSDWSNEKFRRFVKKSIFEFVDKSFINDEIISRFLSIFFYVSNDINSEKGWREIGEYLREDKNIVRAFYLAVPPSIFAPICQKIAKYGYWQSDARVVVEKPLGHDLQSSKIINDAIEQTFCEDQIYRIDHYLGKETVQNLLALRFANMLFEPVWNSAHIDHVQISVCETIGAGTRAYYDETGALRDMVQNHIMQLLCLVAMEPPSSDEANTLRDEKLKVLHSLAPIKGEDVDRLIVRGQYGSVSSEGVVIKSYQDELAQNKKGSLTETFVALKVELNNWRWAGVPFYLRTGKRMAKKMSEIVIQFRDIPHSIFTHAQGKPKPNMLVIRLQPDEGVKLFMMIKDPGPGGMRLKEVHLNLSFADAFNERTPNAYERLLLDVIRGNQTLFMRRDELEAAWKWIDPILEHWQTTKQAPQIYSAGTWGPTNSIALIERDGRTWHEESDF